MNSSKINENILEQLFCITLTRSNLNELLEKCSKSEFKKIVENCFARIQIDGHTLIGRISGVCFPVKVQSFQFGLRFHLAMIGLIPLEQILDELPSSPKEFIPWIQDLKKFKMEPPGKEKILQKIDELNRTLDRNWKCSYAKNVDESNREEVKIDGKDEKLLTEKYPTGKFMENKNCQRTDYTIVKVDDKNKEANSKMKKEISDNQQPTTSTSIALSEENRQFNKHIEEIVGTSEQLGDIYRILISPNEIIHLMQLEKDEFESIMKGLFIHFKMDSKIENIPASLNRFVAQIEGFEWPSFQPGQINYPNFQIKHFGLIQFANIIAHVHPNLMKLCLRRMDELGLPVPSKEFIYQKHQQLSAARQKLMSKFNWPIMKMPPSQISPPTEFSHNQGNNIDQMKLLAPTILPNNRIRQKQPATIKPSNLIRIKIQEESNNKPKINGQIMNKKKESSSSSANICLNSNKNANVDPQTTTNLSSTSVIIMDNKSKDSSRNKLKDGSKSKQLQTIMTQQKEIGQEIEKIIHLKIQKVITNEKDNGNGQTKTTFSPKRQIESGKKPVINMELLKKRRTPSSSISSEKLMEKRMRK